MKHIYTSTLFLLFLQLSFGQIGFFKTNIADNDLGINAPNSLFISDIDGDGDLDVLSGSYTDDKIFWYENINGLGNYGRQQVIANYQSIDKVTDVVAADIDGDGDMDALSSSSGDNKIALYINTDGRGNFGSQEIVSNTAALVNSIDIADIDDDGDLDILSREEDYLVWYENADGLGSFGESIIITSTELSSGEIVSADIDGDGDLDFISRSSIGSNISWYEKTDSLGNFVEHSIPNTSFSNWQVSDIDNDGDMDIVTSDFDTIHLSINLDGLGNFESSQIDYISTANYGQIYLSDIDEDGLTDIIIPLRTRVVWYRNLDGQGNFGDYQFITAPNNAATELVVADADSDEDMDLFFVSRNDDKVGFYKNNNEEGEFWEFVPISLSYLGNPRYASFSDIDGDGDLDILCSAPDLSWYENLDGQGNYGFKQCVYVSSVGTCRASYYSEAIDIDNDGDLDILTLSDTSGSISWLENLDGLGNFGEMQLIDEINYSAKTVRTADFDGDGDLDVITSSWANSRVAWYENMDGLGDFGERQNLDPDSIGARFCLPVDIDGDEDIDIVIAKGYELNWFENLDGQGNFGDSKLIIDNLELITDISTKDLDNDGDFDIIFSTNTSGGWQIEDSISWLENLDGLGNFGGNQDLITSLGEDSFDLADMDNDGDLDLVASSYSTSSTSFLGWFENIDGQGNFDSTRLAIDANNTYTFVNTADIDGDGDMDVISGRNGKLLIHENLGVLGNEFNGIVQLDLNAEGCNNEAQVLNNVQITSNNGNQSFSAFTTENTGYQLPVNEGEFTTLVSGQLPDYYVVTPISYNSSFVGVGNVESLDFCIAPTGAFKDLNISIYPSLNNPRPGFDTTYQLVYNNVGTTQLSGTVAFEFDETKLNLLNTSETIASQTANTLTFGFTDLNPFETSTIDLEFNVFAPPTTNIDDVLVSTATINPISGDETEEDNVFTLEQTVIGSYDPNDIAVLEGEEIFIEDADNYLHYLIRFQNTGTASAINVKVDHVLDNKLDWTSMQLESLSHTGRVEIINETDVSFTFKNINLPDSTNDEPNSHGFIAFKIKPKSDVVVGDIFSGVADIYFDFNPPIITNTVNTEIVASLSVEDYRTQKIQVFPNPAKEELRLTSNKIINKISIIDINGRLLNSLEVSNNEYSLDISKLSKGVYFLQIQSGELKSIKKFIKN